jgi:hypothetical protein
MKLLVCIHILLCKYICIYVYIYIFIKLCTYIYIYIYVYVFTNTNIEVCIYVYTRICICMILNMLTPWRMKMKLLVRLYNQSVDSTGSCGLLHCQKIKKSMLVLPYGYVPLARTHEEVLTLTFFTFRHCKKDRTSPCRQRTDIYTCM